MSLDVDFITTGNMTTPNDYLMNWHLLTLTQVGLTDGGLNRLLQVQGTKFG